MKNGILIFLLVITCISCYAINSDPLSVGTKRVVVKLSLNKHYHYLEPIDLPEVIYHEYDSTISIDFGNQPIEDYTVTISSPFTDVDYYVTSSYTTIPLLVDGYSDYTIIIETSDGDVFEGTLAASDYTTTATM